MKKYTIKHGNGEETIEADSCTSEGGHISFKRGDFLVAGFNAAYVHSIREVQVEKKTEEKTTEKKEQTNTGENQNQDQQNQNQGGQDQQKQS